MSSAPVPNRSLTVPVSFLRDNGENRKVTSALGLKGDIFPEGCGAGKEGIIFAGNRDEYGGHPPARGWPHPPAPASAVDPLMVKADFQVLLWIRNFLVFFVSSGITCLMRDLLAGSKVQNCKVQSVYGASVLV